MGTTKRFSCKILCSESIADNYFLANQQYSISQKKLLLSSDVEKNPGPIQSNNSLTKLPLNEVLEQRLSCFQLQLFDIGKDGDCFFRAVTSVIW